MRHPTADEAANQGCDHDALAALSGGFLEPDKQRQVLDHLRRCAACQQVYAWLLNMDRLLGGATPNHPGSSAILDYAERKLDRRTLQQMKDHLLSCELCGSLADAARAGLDEAERIERTLRFRAQHSDLDADTLYLVASIGQPPRLLLPPPALTRPPPVPEDRRILEETAGLFRVVYFRWCVGGHAAVFWQQPGSVEAVRCALDDRSLSPVDVQPEGMVFDLGHAGQLLGRTLSITLRVHGVDRTWSWTLIKQ